MLILIRHPGAYFRISPQSSTILPAGIVFPFLSHLPIFLFVSLLILSTEKPMVSYIPAQLLIHSSSISEPFVISETFTPLSRMYCTSSTSPGYSIGSPPAILNSATSAPAMQLSTIFSQSSTGSVSFVPNFEKHCRHLKLHASRTWRLILYFSSNIFPSSFLYFCDISYLICEIFVRGNKKMPAFFAGIEDE